MRTPPSACAVLLACGLAAPAFAQGAPAPPSTPGPAGADQPAPTAPGRVWRPTVLEQSQAAYPADAISDGPSGDVSVALTIDTAGQVTGTSIVHGIAPALDRAALQAASRWRFKPAVRDGGPVASRIQLLFHFDAPSPAQQAAARAAAAPTGAGGAPAAAPLPVATPVPSAPAPAP